MTNAAIADHFSLLSKLTDIHGENSFKSKSYASAAYTIDHLTQDVATLPKDELYQMRGIGQSTGEKILELVNTGAMTALENLLARTPAGIVEMMEIKGLGPKKIAAIWKELGIDTIGDLEYACCENRLAALKGFGEKTQQTVLDSIAFYRRSQGFHLWAETEQLAAQLAAQLQRAFPNNQFAVTGDIRRQTETVEYLEIACDMEQDDLLRGYGHLEGVTIETTPADRLTVRIPGQPALKFYLSSPQHFTENLFRSTGSAAFIEAFSAGFVIPENAGSEADIFRENNLAFIPPALRENAAVLQRAANSKELPALITLNDIRGIIHAHSKWSDGANTIGEMARGAMAAGYEYLVISDHSQAAQYAGGLKPAQITAQHQEIDLLNKKLAPFRIFKSIEADILGDGSLDYDAGVLSSFDLVIASVHSNLKMSREKAMDRLLAAIRNPFTTILGHPTGRLLLSREGYPVDHKALIDACAANNVVIEINAHPRRLDIDWRWVEYALEKGVLLSVDPDAHSVSGYRDVYYGVMIGQKGGLTAAQNLSSFALPAFEAFLESYRRKKA